MWYGVWEIIPEQRQIEGEREELTDKNSGAGRATWAPKAKGEIQAL